MRGVVVTGMLVGLVVWDLANNHGQLVAATVHAAKGISRQIGLI